MTLSCMLPELHDPVHAHCDPQLPPPSQHSHSRHAHLPPPAPQTTLYQMADTVIARVHQVESVFLNMPNVHFLPCAPPSETFADDVYVATSEPHGNIEAVVTRKGSVPHAKF